MNGAPLPAPRAASRSGLMAPGWYGVANVKWLTRIEVVDQRYAGRFMARDYVSIREQKRGEETVWTFSNVNHMRLKSAPAKVTRQRGRYTVMGAAWGAPIADVEVRIDDGPVAGRPDLDRRRGARGRDGFASGAFWTLPWGKASAGERRVASRAYRWRARQRPSPRPKEPFLASRCHLLLENNGQIGARLRV